MIVLGGKRESQITFNDNDNDDDDDDDGDGDDGTL